MTTNAGRGAAQEPLEGGGGSEGLGREVGLGCYRRAWRFPRLIAYRVANPARLAKAAWNRYGDGGAIGVAVVVRSWCISLTWARPLGVGGSR